MRDAGYMQDTTSRGFTMVFDAGLQLSIGSIRTGPENTGNYLDEALPSCPCCSAWLVRPPAQVPKAARGLSVSRNVLRDEDAELPTKRLATPLASRILALCASRPFGRQWPGPSHPLRRLCAAACCHHPPHRAPAIRGLRATP